MLDVVEWENRRARRKHIFAFRAVNVILIALFYVIRIQFLRDVRSFFATSFKIVSADPPDPECSQLIYSCYGTGYVNANRTLA